MGRKRIRTDEEKLEQVKLRMRKYYDRHKDKIKRKNLKRYYDKRNLQNSKQD